MRRKLLAAIVALFDVFDLRDWFVFGGIGLSTYGIYQLNEPAAWIFVGLMLLFIGLKR